MLLRKNKIRLVIVPRWRGSTSVMLYFQMGWTKAEYSSWRTSVRRNRSQIVIQKLAK